MNLISGNVAKKRSVAMLSCLRQLFMSCVSVLAIAAAFCSAFCLPTTLQGQTWTHPGIVVSQAQLDATRAAYQAGNPVVVDQVNKAKNSNYGSLTYTVQGPWPGGINLC